MLENFGDLCDSQVGQITTPRHRVELTFWRCPSCAQFTLPRQINHQTNGRKRNQPDITERNCRTSRKLVDQSNRVQPAKERFALIFCRLSKAGCRNRQRRLSDFPNERVLRLVGRSTHLLSQGWKLLSPERENRRARPRRGRLYQSS